MRLALALLLLPFLGCCSGERALSDSAGGGSGHATSGSGGGSVVAGAGSAVEPDSAAGGSVHAEAGSAGDGGISSSAGASGASVAAEAGDGGSSGALMVETAAGAGGASEPPNPLWSKCSPGVCEVTPQTPICGAWVDHAGDPTTFLCTFGCWTLQGTKMAPEPALVAQCGKLGGICLGVGDYYPVCVPHAPR